MISALASKKRSDQKNYLAEELVESLSLSSAGSVLEVTTASSGALLLVACCCSIMEDLIEVKRLKTDDVETGGGALCKENIEG